MTWLLLFKKSGSLKLGFIRSGPRLYLNIGRLFLDLGWFHAHSAEPVYGPALSFERIHLEGDGSFTCWAADLSMRWGTDALTLVAGLSDIDREVQ